MKKILLLPLDERPCNYDFPNILPHNGFELLMPPISIMGNKKKAADCKKIEEWLLKNAGNADGAILSIDMLLFGGIVPSRLHHLTPDEIERRTDFLYRLKKLNPNIIIFAFQLIMRCPTYSSDDEEPDYYGTIGEDIYNAGRMTHLEQLGMLLDEQKKEKELLIQKISGADYNDYLSRRKLNTDSVLSTLKLVKQKVIDYFIIPQDDSSPYGFTAMDQIKVRKHIKENGMEFDVSMYPGADEIGLTLLARMQNMFSSNVPNIYVHYASALGGQVVPMYEDRIIDETIKCQIYACGGRRVSSLAECDILLAVNIGSEMLSHNDPKWVQAYDINRNLVDLIYQIEHASQLNKAVALADVGIPSGGDLELLRLLGRRDMLFKLDGYAGWNTSSNTIGCALCQAILNFINPDALGNSAFLVHRYLEDMCYCSYAKWHIVNEHLSELGLGYFDSGDVQGMVSEIVKNEILQFAKEHLYSVYNKVESLEVQMPWRRMFEVSIKAKTVFDKK